MKSGTFFVDKTKDESKDLLQQILDKSMYTENDFKGTTSLVLVLYQSYISPILTKAQTVHSKLKLKYRFEYYI